MKASFGYGVVAMMLASLPAAAHAGAQQSGSFSCAAKAAVPLTAATRYADGPTGAGWDLVDSPKEYAGGACAGTGAFFFSMSEPDGNYQVTVVLGGPAASDVTVKAESRRLMVDRLAVKAGGSQTVVFNVNVRTDKIAGTDQKVRLKPREVGALDWDDKLTLEFNGEHPSVRSIAIKPVDVPTIYIAGDSTVVDQDKEPWAAWGQMLPVFFTPMVSIANEAESGETIKSFVGERRLAKVMSTMKSGDYLMVQFGHNDQKPGGGYVDANTEYKTILNSYISQAEAKGAQVILVTPMNRRNFDSAGKIVQTLGLYPQALRDVAAEHHLGLVDLNAMSKTLFEAMGPEGTVHAFVHYPANTFPDQKDELKDDTHFNAYGAYELARCVVESVKTQGLVIAKYLKPGIPAFDPAKPDALAAFRVPASPFLSVATPYERK